MKKTRLFSSLLANEFHQNKRRYFVVSAVFFIGIVGGAWTSSCSELVTDVRQYVTSFMSSYTLSGAAKNNVFQLSLLNYIKFAFFLWVSGWYRWLFPLCFLQVFSKGFRTGFTVACFVQCYSLKGILLSFITLLPQNLIFLPALLFFSVYQFQFLSDRRYLVGGNGNKNFQKQIYGKNVFYCVLFLILLFLCALIEGYLVPVCLQPLCSVFI